MSDEPSIVDWCQYGGRGPERTGAACDLCGKLRGEGCQPHIALTGDMPNATPDSLAWWSAYRVALEHFCAAL